MPPPPPLPTPDEPSATWDAPHDPGSIPEQPRIDACPLCATPVAAGARRCDACGFDLAASPGLPVLDRRGMWLLVALVLATYVVTLVIVAATR